MNQNQYVETPTISSHRMRIGSSMKYLAPKICLEEIIVEPDGCNQESMQENNSHTDNNEEVPKFKSVKMIVEEVANQQKLQKEMIKEILHDDYIKKLNIWEEYLRAQKKHSKIYHAGTIIIWMSYLLSGLSNEIGTFGVFSIINLVGVFLAIFLSIYTIFIQHKGIGIDILLHSLSLVLTIVNHFYKSDDQHRTFLMVMWGVRNLRLLFIINYKWECKYLMYYYFNKVVQIMKLVPFWFISMVVFSVVMTNSSGFAYYNRCTTPVGELGSFPERQFMMCGLGASQCSNGLVCSNPFSYGMKPDANFSNSQALAFGSFSYINLFHSFYTNMCSGFLSNTSKIIRIYSNAIPSMYIAFINVLIVLLSHLYLFPIVIITLKSQLKENMQNQGQNHSNYQDNDHSHKYQSEKPENSSALTFGPESCKENVGKMTKIGQLSAEQKTSSNIVTNNMDASNLATSQMNSIIIVNQKDKSSKKKKTKERKQMKPAVIETKCNVLLKYIVWMFLVAIGIVHFSLSLASSTKKQGDAQGQLIGICLMIIFIIWSLLVFLNFLGVVKREKGQGQSIELMLRVEMFIYALHTFDYLYQYMLGLKLMESQTAITPLVTSSLFLRVIYLPYLYEQIMKPNAIMTTIIAQTSTLIKIITIIIKYALAAFLLAIIVSSFTSIMSGIPLIYEVAKYMKMITNTNWVQDGTLNGINASLDLGYGMLLKGFLILVGQLILLKLMFSQILAFMILESTNKNQLNKLMEEQCFEAKEMVKVDVQRLIKQQKTFNFIQFQSCLRSNLFSLVTSSTYKQYRLISCVIYMIFAWIYATYLQDNKICSYLIFGMDMLILIDQLFTIIALRFWGEGSFINYQSYTFANFCSSFFIIIAFSISGQLAVINFLRCFRFATVINYSDNLKKAYQQLTASFLILVRNIANVLILWIFLTIALALLHVHNSDEGESLSWFQMDNSFRFLEKGFDLNTELTIKQAHNSKAISFMVSMLYYIFGLSLNFYFIGTILRHLKQQKERSYYQNITQFAQKHKLNIKKRQIFMRINTEYELHAIKQRILSITPQKQAVRVQVESIFTKIIGLKYYNYVKMPIVLASLFITLTLIAGLGGEVQFQLKTAKIFLYLWEISFWMMESLSNNATSPTFKLEVAIRVLSFPGHIFMYLPFHKFSNDSLLLVHMFQFIGMVAPLPLTGALGLVQSFNCTTIIDYIKKKIEITCSLLLLTFFVAFSFSTLINIYIQEDSVYTFSMVLIGMFGGTYQAQLYKEEDHHIYTLCFLQIFMFLVGLIMRSTLVAYLIYQVLHESEECFNCHKKVVEISELSLNKILDDEKFMALWQRLDPEGSGMLPFKTVINHIHQFSRCFNLVKQYIEFLIHNKPELYDLKLSLFKKLNIPIRSASFHNKETNERSNQYVILMHDLISKFLCLALEENIQNINVTEHFKDLSASAASYKNWVQEFQFEDKEWNEEVLMKLKENKKIKSSEQIQKTYSLRPIEMHSWSLGILLNLLPTLRKKISKIQQKHE